jgi:cytochrome c2
MKTVNYETLSIKVRDTKDVVKGKDIFYKCNNCQSIIPSTPKDNTGCSCGNIEIDKDYNRLWIGDYSNFVILKVKK